eukprot:GHVS01036183.1.p1 GENE.GHVS01036183.1~~GHVS01036183.1.p1  ORF type:complete len:980 (-),score=121.89 GHVS01036183.1:1718-4657(-)
MEVSFPAAVERASSVCSAPTPRRSDLRWEGCSPRRSTCAMACARSRTVDFRGVAGLGGTKWRDEVEGDGRRRALSDEFDVAGGGGNETVGGAYSLSGSSSVTSLMMMALEGGGVHSLSSKVFPAAGKNRALMRADHDTCSIRSVASCPDQAFSTVGNIEGGEETYNTAMSCQGGGGETTKSHSRVSTVLSRISRMKSVAFRDVLYPMEATAREKKKPHVEYDRESQLSFSRNSSDDLLVETLLYKRHSTPYGLICQSSLTPSPRNTIATCSSEVERDGDLMRMMSSVDSFGRASLSDGDEEQKEAEEDRQRRMLWRRKRDGGTSRVDGSFASLRSRTYSSRVPWRWSESPEHDGSRGRKMMGRELQGDIVLVTGATSFLGCHLVMALLDRGVCVRAVTRRLLSCSKSPLGSVRRRESREVTEGGEWLMRVHPNAGRQLQVVEGDVYGGEDEWRQLFDGCRYMVWACARVSPTAANGQRQGEGLDTTESEDELVDEEDTEESVHDSIKGAHNVFGWGAKYGVTRAVIMSTISEYSRGCRVLRHKCRAARDESDDRQACPNAESASGSMFDKLLRDALWGGDGGKSGDGMGLAIRRDQGEAIDESLEEQGEGKGTRASCFVDDNHWSDPTAENAVFRQRTLTEMAAWDVARKCPSMELVSVCSGWVFGSVLLQRHCKCMSLQVIEGLLLGRWPRLPVYGYPPVDVRDVAVAGVLGLILPTEQVAGQRLLVGAHETISLSQVGCILKIEFGEFGFEPNTSETTTSSMVVAETMEASSDADGTLISPQGGSGSECSSLSSGKSLINPCNEEMSRTRTDLWWYWNHERFGRLVKVDLSWSKSVLGIEYRPVAKAIVDSVMSMMALRILPQRRVPDDLIEFALFYQMGYRLSDRQRQRCSYSQRGSIDVPTLILQQGLRETTSERIEGGEEAVRQGFVRGPLGTRLRQKVMTRGGEDVIWARDTNCRDSGRNNCLWPQVTDDLFF